MAEIPQDRAQIIARLKAIHGELIALLDEDAVNSDVPECWGPRDELAVAADCIDGAIWALE